MTQTQPYKSEGFAAIHETTDALHQIGSIDKRTMRNFDATCLSPVAAMKPSEIRKLRERERVSQPVFALYLNVSRNIVSDWERGVKKPSGPSLRLLSIVQKHGLDALVA